MDFVIFAVWKLHFFNSIYQKMVCHNLQLLLSTQSLRWYSKTCERVEMKLHSKHLFMKHKSVGGKKQRPPRRWWVHIFYGSTNTPGTGTTTVQVAREGCLWLKVVGLSPVPLNLCMRPPPPTSEKKRNKYARSLVFYISSVAQVTRKHCT